MKHLFRFFGSRASELQWTLAEDEWHHLLKVLRLSVGDAFELCDGEGFVASARLTEAGKTRGAFSIESESYTARPKEDFTLGLGVLKPAGIDEVLPGLVELGVSRIVLIPFIGMDKSRVNDKLLDRWQRQIVSAGKQAKAPWFPSLHVAKSLDAFLSETREAAKFLLDPSGEVLSLEGRTASPVVAVVGSEGGWSESEVMVFREAGFELLRIRSNILRATTAALATAAIFRQGLRS